ncbi:MAG: hypothetical protein HYT27_03195 [Parcubacteria group bacterium]|nr:hypothetical protein [Parcubacteria group bacterium]
MEPHRLTPVVPPISAKGGNGRRHPAVAGCAPQPSFAPPSLKLRRTSKASEGIRRIPPRLYSRGILRRRMK